MECAQFTLSEDVSAIGAWGSGRGCAQGTGRRRFLYLGNILYAASRLPPRRKETAYCDQSTGAPSYSASTPRAKCHGSNSFPPSFRWYTLSHNSSMYSWYPGWKQCRHAYRPKSVLGPKRSLHTVFGYKCLGPFPGTKPALGSKRKSRYHPFLRSRIMVDILAGALLKQRNGTLQLENDEDDEGSDMVMWYRSHTRIVYLRLFLQLGCDLLHSEGPKSLECDP